MKRRFKQVDVFTTVPFQGNPVAVILDSEGLDDAAMQRIARWTNLSETTFVLPPTQAGADYRLRIFTPGAELPFAGHPTLGSAHAVLEAGIVDAGRNNLVQECEAGLVPIAVERSAAGLRLLATVPTPRLRPVPVEHLPALRRALGAQWASEHVPMIVNVGAVWIIVPLADASTLAGLKPDLPAMAELSNALEAGGVTAFARLSGAADAIKVRSFAPAHGVNEDPVCGSGNASVGAYVAHSQAFADLLPAYTSSQGREIGRDGHVAVRASREVVQIGGASVTCVDGMMVAPPPPALASLAPLRD